MSRRIVEHGLQEAQHSAQRGYCNYRHGAVVMVRSKVVARGYNHQRSFAFTQRRQVYESGRQGTTIHAERDALQNLLRRYGRIPKGARLFVCRDKGQGVLSKPCKICMQMIQKYRIPLYWPP